MLGENQRTQRFQRRAIHVEALMPIELLPHREYMIPAELNPYDRRTHSALTISYGYGGSTNAERRKVGIRIGNSIAVLPALAALVMLIDERDRDKSRRRPHYE